MSQYAHTTWQFREGFTQGYIKSVAQTPDGYIWLGTGFGLFRFDGVRVEHWHPPLNGEQLRSNLVVSLDVARDGTHWIGTMKGLASCRDGRLTRYPDLAGLIISSRVAIDMVREGLITQEEAPSSCAPAALLEFPAATARTWLVSAHLLKCLLRFLRR